MKVRRRAFLGEEGERKWDCYFRGTPIHRDAGAKETVFGNWRKKSMHHHCVVGEASRKQNSLPRIVVSICCSQRCSVRGANTIDAWNEKRGLV
jgi:hypothetical protein